MVGYKVSNFVDINNKKYDDKEFISHQQSSRNLTNAKRYIDSLEEKNNVMLEKYKNLPNGIYLKKYYKNGNQIYGFVVKHCKLIKYDNKTKSFTSITSTVDEKYQKAIDYLEELKNTKNFIDNCS